MVVDADLISRKQSRQIVGALAELTATPLVIGALGDIETDHALQRITARSGQLGPARNDLAEWKAGMQVNGLLSGFSERALMNHRRTHPGIHQWLEEVWRDLDGDFDDIDHVAVGIATGAEAFVTGNRRCINARKLAERALRDGKRIPRVMQRDACLDYFAEKMGPRASRIEALEAAVLPAAAHKEDFVEMWRRLLPKIEQSFPDTVAEFGVEVKHRSHEHYQRRLQALTGGQARQRRSRER